MNTGATLMLAFGATLLWGGLAVTLLIAVLKSKNSSNNQSESKDVSV